VHWRPENVKVVSLRERHDQALWLVGWLTERLEAKRNEDA
jgi:hypothetical protein